MRCRLVAAVYNPLEDLEMIDDFVQEANERLELVADHAMAAEEGDQEAWDALRREIHTLKGAAGFVGLDSFSELCHELEDFLIRAEGRQWDAAFDLVHESCELLRDLVATVEACAHAGKPMQSEPRATVLSNRLRTG